MINYTLTNGLRITGVFYTPVLGKISKYNREIRVFINIIYKDGRVIIIDDMFCDFCKMTNDDGIKAVKNFSKLIDYLKELNEVLIDLMYEAYAGDNIIGLEIVDYLKLILKK